MVALKTASGDVMIRFVCGVLGLVFAASMGQAACDGQEACEVETGAYHAVAPEGEVKGALVFLHG